MALGSTMVSTDTRFAGAYVRQVSVSIADNDAPVTALQDLTTRSSFISAGNVCAHHRRQAPCLERDTGPFASVLIGPLGSILGGISRERPQRQCDVGAAA